MPRVSRNYEREDFSSLLKELNGIQTDLEPEKERKIQEKNPDIVNLATRRRASLMDRRNMRYAYSVKEKVLHDRDCELVSKIANEEFDMLEVLDEKMTFCKKCYRRGIVRNGIREDGKRINAYLRFFNDAGASNKDLHKLIIEGKAELKWEDRNTITIHQGEDTWKIVHKENEYMLLHNNYICLEDDTRIFRDGFHEQNVYGRRDFHNFVHVICRYSWQDHVESMKQRREEAQKGKKSEIVDIRKSDNFVKIKKFSLLYYHYAYLDTKDYLADQLFVNNKVKVRFGREYEKGEYRIIFCKIRKRDNMSFLAALSEMADKAALMGETVYEEFVKSMENIWK